MTSTTNFKSSALVRIGASSSLQNESDSLHGLSRKAKVGCLIIGIPCFGLLFVLSLLLVVSGVAVLWINNMDSEDDLPEFFDYPFDSAGTIMVFSGVIMLVGLICLWYTTEKRNYPSKRKSKRVLRPSSSACEPYLYPTGETGPSIVSDECTSYPISGTLCHLGHADVAPRQMADCSPSEPDQLPPYPEESEYQMSYPSAPPKSQLSYPSAPSEIQNMSYASTASRSQMFYTSSPSDGRISYLTPTSECQISYSHSPAMSQTLYANPTIGTLNNTTRNSVHYSHQYSPSTEQMYYPRAIPSEQISSGLPVTCTIPHDADLGFTEEMPPPYTP